MCEPANDGRQCTQPVGKWCSEGLPSGRHQGQADQLDLPSCWQEVEAPPASKVAQNGRQYRIDPPQSQIWVGPACSPQPSVRSWYSCLSRWHHVQTVSTSSRKNVHAYGPIMGDRWSSPCVMLGCVHIWFQCNRICAHDTLKLNAPGDFGAIPCAHLDTMAASMVTRSSQRNRTSPLVPPMNDNQMDVWVRQFTTDSRPDMANAVRILSTYPPILRLLRRAASSQGGQWSIQMQQIVQRLLYAEVGTQTPQSPMPRNHSPMMLAMTRDTRIHRHNSEADDTWSTTAEVGGDDINLQVEVRSAIVAAVNELTPFAAYRDDWSPPDLSVDELFDGIILITNNILTYGHLWRYNNNFGPLKLASTLSRYGLPLDQRRQKVPDWAYNKTPAQAAVQWLNHVQVFDQMDRLAGTGNQHFTMPWKKCCNCERTAMSNSVAERIGNKFDNRTKRVLAADGKDMKEFCCGGCMLAYASQRPNGPPKGAWHCGSRCAGGPRLRDGTNPKKHQLNRREKHWKIHPFYQEMAQQVAWGLARVHGHNTWVRLQRRLTEGSLRHPPTQSVPTIHLVDGRQYITWSESQPSTRAPSEDGEASVTSTALSRI